MDGGDERWQYIDNNRTPRQPPSIKMLNIDVNWVKNISANTVTGE